MNQALGGGGGGIRDDSEAREERQDWNYQLFERVFIPSIMSIF